jgi:hypothetical protein
MERSVAYQEASKMSSYERDVVEAPDYYTAIAFRGRNQFERREAPDMEATLAAAAEIYEDRPIAIYAVRGGRQAMIGTWRP